MQRKWSSWLMGLAAASSLALGGCVVAPPRPVAVVAPVRVWVPGYWAYGNVWVAGHWRWR